VNRITVDNFVTVKSEDDGRLLSVRRSEVVSAFVARVAEWNKPNARREWRLDVVMKSGVHWHGYYATQDCADMQLDLLTTKRTLHKSRFERMLDRFESSGHKAVPWALLACLAAFIVVMLAFEPDCVPVHSWRDCAVRSK
jgi:hypothetical protein